MTRAAIEARRAYKREWQRRNKDKVKAYCAAYWERKAQAAAEESGKQLAVTQPEAR